MSDFRNPQTSEELATNYANYFDYKGKRLGWMAETLIENFEPNQQLTRIKAIQELKAHRNTPSRTSWLCHWTGAATIWELEEQLQNKYLTEDEVNEIEQRLELLRSLFDSLCKFLAVAWTDHHFRPFDTIDRAEQYLHTRKDCFLVRLSSTQPCTITVSFNDRGNVRHKRFRINSSSQIVDSNGHTYDDISKLASFCTVFSSPSRKCLGYDIF